MHLTVLSKFECQMLLTIKVLSIQQSERTKVLRNSTLAWNQFSMLVQCKTMAIVIISRINVGGRECLIALACSLTTLMWRSPSRTCSLADVALIWGAPFILAMRGNSASNSGSIQTCDENDAYADIILLLNWTARQRESRIPLVSKQCACADRTPTIHYQV